MAADATAATAAAPKWLRSSQRQMSRNIGIGEFLALVIGCSTPPAMSATTVVAWAPGRAHAPAPDRGEHVRLMLEHALRGREPPDDELRRVAVRSEERRVGKGWWC